MYLHECLCTLMLHTLTCSRRSGSGTTASTQEPGRQTGNYADLIDLPQKVVTFCVNSRGRLSSGQEFVHRWPVACVRTRRSCTGKSDSWTSEAICAFHTVGISEYTVAFVR